MIHLHRRYQWIVSFDAGAAQAEYPYEGYYVVHRTSGELRWLHDHLDQLRQEATLTQVGADRGGLWTGYALIGVEDLIGLGWVWFCLIFY